MNCSFFMNVSKFKRHKMYYSVVSRENVKLTSFSVYSTSDEWESDWDRILELLKYAGEIGDVSESEYIGSPGVWDAGASSIGGSAFGASNGFLFRKRK